MLINQPVPMWRNPSVCEITEKSPNGRGVVDQSEVLAKKRKEKKEGGDRLKKDRNRSSAFVCVEGGPDKRGGKATPTISLAGAGSG